ncbi:MAG: alpha/beta hydrolase [Actinomyces sp.]|jgi:predicted alpha/beta hydrolase family esterase|nr:alpha/beta hydrolase [Actinomyces sp.]MCI1788994.1 alpha/beta hydrolase [Actinomyces sp.]MCI1830419.1 alpha/beta hydrolase [Actinomyces sp.]
MASGTTHQRAVIFHGYGATPADHWFGWLAEQLRADGIPTAVPVLSHPSEPDAERWEDEVRTALGAPDEHSIVIAHSLGCLTVLRYLRSLLGPWRLGVLVLVSGFVDRLPALPDLDAYVADGCDVTGLSDHIGRVVVIRSDDDPFVPPALTDRLADLLGAPVRVVPKAGHFLASDGITELPAAREAIAF